MSDKKRLDIFLYENGYTDSREKAKIEIMAGNILVNERRLKASDMVSPKDTIRVIKKLPYVSRGGLKLEKAIKSFNIDLKDKVCLDIGASTGGFTDCMLKNGAKLVYAVDVGYGQLHYSLQKNEKVISMERTNARNIEKSMFEFPIDFVSIDVSFISLKLIFPKLLNILHENSKIVALIKPQFEAGKEKVGKNGVVREKAIHFDVICDIIKNTSEYGFFVENLDFSPIRGPEGNIEFLSMFNIKGSFGQEINVNDTVDLAHKTFA